MLTQSRLKKNLNLSITWSIFMDIRCSCEIHVKHNLHEWNRLCMTWRLIIWQWAFSLGITSIIRFWACFHWIFCYVTFFPGCLFLVCMFLRLWEMLYLTYSDFSVAMTWCRSMMVILMMLRRWILKLFFLFKKN